MDIFKKLFFNKNLKTKGYKINAVKSKPNEDNFNDVSINMVITKDNDSDFIMITIQDTDNEYSLPINKDIIDTLVKFSN